MKVTAVNMGFDGRNSFGHYFTHLGFKVGAEIGVDQGLFSDVLIGSMPELEKLICVDPWLAYDAGVPEYTTQENREIHYACAVNRLKKYNNAFIWRMPSEEASLLLEDESLDFVYIDANHMFKHVLNDLMLWTKKVRIGGIVAGHDYVRDDGHCQVKDAVDLFTSTGGVEELFYTVPHMPSWFFKR